VKFAVPYLLLVLSVAAQDFTDIHLDRVAAGFVFAEGPVWSRDGYLIFSERTGRKKDRRRVLSEMIEDCVSRFSLNV